MAGKHIGAWAASTAPVPGFAWNERLTRAYAEGRADGNGANNPHPAGTPAHQAWLAGASGASDAAQQFETATEAAAGPALNRQLVMDGSTNYIDLPITFDATQNYRLTFTARIDAQANQSLWTENFANNFLQTRGAPSLRTQRLADGPDDAGTYAIDTFIDFEDAWNGTTEQCTLTLTPGGVTVRDHSAGSVTATQQPLRFGANTGPSLFFTGIIRDIRLYDSTDTLTHYYPVDDDNGTVIKDWQGSADGTLVGTGNWIDRT